MLLVGTAGMAWVPVTYEGCWLLKVLASQTFIMIPNDWTDDLITRKKKSKMAEIHTFVSARVDKIKAVETTKIETRLFMMKTL